MNEGQVGGELDKCFGIKFIFYEPNEGHLKKVLLEFPEISALVREGGEIDNCFGERFTI